MSEEKSTKFYEPILSAAGVIASLLAALSPLLPFNDISKLFIVSDYAKPSSLVAFVLSLGMVWIGSSFSPHFNVSIRKNYFLDLFNGWFRRANTQPIQASFYYLNTRHFALFLVALCTLLFCYFISLSKNMNQVMATTQAGVYITFFIIITYLFSMLLSYTKQMYEYKEKKNEFPKTVQNLLENYGILNQGIVFEENKQLSPVEASVYGVNQFTMTRYVKVRIKSQAEVTKELIISDDGQELFKEL